MAIAGGLGLGAIACSPSPSTPAWKTYDNSGWGFEFPYPSTWLAQPAPSKQDGQSFTDPQNAAVEVRGWATVKGVSVVPRSLPAPIQNFQTAQGWLGNLQVEIGRETSTMTLILQGGQIEYGFQGKAPSQEFAAYYSTFAAIAHQYKITRQIQSPARSSHPSVLGGVIWGR